MGPFTMLFLAAIGTAIIIAFGFFLGFAQNRRIDPKGAAEAIKNYDATLELDEIIVSSDGFCAFASAKNKELILINSSGADLSARRISKADIHGRGNEIVLKLDDLGFAPIKTIFDANSLLRLEQFIESAPQNA